MSSASPETFEHNKDQIRWPGEFGTTISPTNSFPVPDSSICCPATSFLPRSDTSTNPPQTPRNPTHPSHRVQDHSHNLPTPPATPEKTRKNTPPAAAPALRVQIQHTAKDKETTVISKALLPRSYLERYAEVRALFVGSSERGREEQATMRRRDVRLAKMEAREDRQA